MFLDEDLQTAVDRLDAELGAIVEGLRDAVLDAAADHEAHGFVASEDPAFYAAAVRRLLRQRLTVIFPTLAETGGNMSPIHIDLGHDQLKVLHARDGDVPPPESDARKAFYLLNEQGQLSLDLDGTADRVTVSTSLVIVWDAVGAELTQAELCRPVLHGESDKVDLLLLDVVAEDDLDITRTETGIRLLRTADEQLHEEPTDRVGDSDDDDR